MRQSRLFSPTLRDAPSEAEVVSHQLLLRAGFIRQLASGISTYLPLGWRVLRKVQQIIREEMDQAGAQEIRMPAMQPAELWTESGRYADYGPELIRLDDRHGREFVLGPTHEEVVTALVRDELKSYRQLPFTLYQIQTKFRDERRPRFGLLRGREFLMKDAYSFAADWNGLEQAYRVMYDAYQQILTRCELDFRAVQADAGTIGAEGETHEFLVLADIGEDTMLTCLHCDYAANIEQYEKQYGAAELSAQICCPGCGQGALKWLKGIEVGHIFKLGTKYSEKQGACYIDDHGRQQPVIMGCYGIGISRLMAAIAQQHHDESGLTWPVAIAPFHVHLIPVSLQDEQQRQLADRLYESLRRLGAEVLLDDRDERPGVKFKDSELMGIPVQIVIGKQAGEGFVEYKQRSGKERKIVGVAEAIDEVKKFVDV